MSQRLLPGLLVVVLLVATALWLGPGRTVRATILEDPPVAVREEDSGPLESGAVRQPSQRVEAATARQEPGLDVAPVEEPGVRLVSGRLRLDGHAPPSDTRVYVQAPGQVDHGPWLVLPEGGFTVSVPGTSGADLEFRLNTQGPRTLLLPRVPLAGLEEEALELDWHSKHLNVRVTGDPAGWNGARLRVTGPGLETELEVGGNGRLALAVFRPGRYVLAARHASGASARAELVVGEETDLETVVLSLAQPG
jgi:hypothetical protein